MVNRTNLTDRQIQVLKMRSRGMTVTEIASRLGTSRSNISIIETQAKANIVRSERTLELAKMLRAPIWIEVEPDTDIYNIPGMIYSEADRKNIWIPNGGPSLLAIIETKAQDRLRERRVLKKIEIGITEEGEVLVY